jgi:hypothetical protein
MKLVLFSLRHHTNVFIFFIFFHVSVNTAALNKSFQRLKMSSTVDSTCETVADALHLQNSIIGMVYWCYIHYVDFVHATI